MDPKILEKVLFLERGRSGWTATEEKRFTLAMKSSGIRWVINLGAGVWEAGVIFWREALGMWAEWGPGTASHLHHSDRGLKAQLNPAAAATKEWGAVK